MEVEGVERRVVCIHSFFPAFIFWRLRSFLSTHLVLGKGSGNYSTPDSRCPKGKEQAGTKVLRPLSAPPRGLQACVQSSGDLQMIHLNEYMQRCLLTQTTDYTGGLNSSVSHNAETVRYFWRWLLGPPRPGYHT